jgi:hypothetical protein
MIYNQAAMDLVQCFLFGGVIFGEFGFQVLSGWCLYATRFRLL